MFRFATAFLAFSCAATSAAAAEPRLWDAAESCRGAVLGAIPTPATYVERDRSVIWGFPVAGDGRTQAAPDRTPSDDLSAEVNWAEVRIIFDAQNVFGALLRREVKCIIEPVYGDTEPAVVVIEVDHPERCTIKSLCSRP